MKTCYFTATGSITMAGSAEFDDRCEVCNACLHVCPVYAVEMPMMVREFMRSPYLRICHLLNGFAMIFAVNRLLLGRSLL